MSRRGQWQINAVTAAVAAVIALAWATIASAQSAVQEPCARGEFESVVDDAGEILRTLNQKNSPAFQAKLRALKDKRGWSHDQFLAEGTRFVRDEKIAAFEEKSATLLAKINGAGGDVVKTTGGDCARLADLKADMSALVGIQNEKWMYMFATIDAALAQ